MRSVLVVDDEPYVTRVTRLCLERAGYEVEVVADGKEALELLRWRQFDAVITDIVMPRMSGRELCTTIRESMPELDLPLLVLTSSSEEEHRDWARELPRTELLEKPVSPRQLVERLAELLGDDKSGDRP